MFNLFSTTTKESELHPVKMPLHDSVMVNVSDSQVPLDGGSKPHSSSSGSIQFRSLSHTLSGGDEKKLSYQPLPSSYPGSPEYGKSDFMVVPRTLQMNGRGLLDPSKSYKFRLTTDTTAVNASSSDTATAKVSYDPSGSTEFSALAGLFGLYKVCKINVHLWPSTPGDPAVSVPLKTWIVAADPSMLVSGTPTAQTSASLAYVERLTGHNTTTGVCKTFHPSCKSSLVANLAPTRDGYILCTVLWPGQWVSFSKTFASTSLSHFTYQVDYEVSFKSRG
jgi:hypothetical protein